MLVAIINLQWLACGWNAIVGVSALEDLIAWPARRSAMTLHCAGRSRSSNAVCVSWCPFVHRNDSLDRLSLLYVEWMCSVRSQSALRVAFGYGVVYSVRRLSVVISPWLSEMDVILRSGGRSIWVYLLMWSKNNAAESLPYASARYIDALYPLAGPEF